MLKEVLCENVLYPLSKWQFARDVPTEIDTWKRLIVDVDPSWQRDWPTTHVQLQCFPLGIVGTKVDHVDGVGRQRFAPADLYKFECPLCCARGQRRREVKMLTRNLCEAAARLERDPQLALDESR